MDSVFPVETLCKVQGKIEVSLSFLNSFLSIHDPNLNYVFEPTHVNLRCTLSRSQSGGVETVHEDARQGPGLSFRGSQVLVIHFFPVRCRALVIALLKMVLSLQFKPLEM